MEIIRTFFDYIFYNLYRFFQWQDRFWDKMGAPNFRKGDLFDPLLVLSFFQGLNITTAIILIAIVIGYPQYVKDFDDIYVIAVAGMYICNYLYYQKKGNYKHVIEKMGKRKTSAFLVILYSIFFSCYCDTKFPFNS